jgi:putative protease
MEAIMSDQEIEVAEVQDYYHEVGVAALKVISDIRIGDVLHFRGSTTDLLQEISSMQIDHAQIKRARPGDRVGIKVMEKVRPHDRVYKVFPENEF